MDWSPSVNFELSGGRPRGASALSIIVLSFLLCGFVTCLYLMSCMLCCTRWEVDIELLSSFRSVTVLLRKAYYSSQVSRVGVASVHCQVEI